MHVHIVRAPTRHKVLLETRRCHGPDALILSVRRQLSRDGKGYEWEAIVASEPTADFPPVSLGDQAILEPTATRPEEAAGASAAIDRGEPQGAIDMLQEARRLAELESELVSGLWASQVPAEWLPVLKRLHAAGYPEADALRLLCQAAPKDIAPEEDLSPRVREYMALQVAVAPASERVRPGLVVFVGATGVGKTTLATKLAADLCISGSHRPVLGVLHPNRAVDVETVERCADTLGIDFVSASDEDVLMELADRADDTPIILDSSAVNPLDGAALTELRHALSAIPNAEIHAVAPASYSQRDFEIGLCAFQAAGATRLSVTRLDEAPHVGRVLAAAARSRMPIGYLSRGQRIPDDLVRPALDSLLKAVFQPEAIAAL